MNYLKDFISSNAVRRFAWITFAGFLSLITVYLGGVDWIYAPVIAGIIGTITKELNNKYGNVTE
jgi:hypothetical protein